MLFLESYKILKFCKSYIVFWLDKKKNRKAKGLNQGEAF